MVCPEVVMDSLNSESRRDRYENGKGSPKSMEKIPKKMFTCQSRMDTKKRRQGMTDLESWGNSRLTFIPFPRRMPGHSRDACLQAEALF